MIHNSPKRIYLPDAVYFVTTKTKDNYPYFRDRRLAELCVDKVRFALQIKRFNLMGYVILPDHLHLLIQPKGKVTISEIMHCIKRNVARSANIMMQNMHYSNKYTDEDNHSRLLFQWQHSFHDHIIRNDKDLITHLDYIRYNPEKHGIRRAGETYPFIFIVSL